jgi:S1-C subfamily serine protease
VLTLDGKPMENGRQFRINVYTRGVGERVALEVRRGERTLTVGVAVVERENDTGQLETLIGSQKGIRDLGIIALDLSPAIANMLPDVRRDKGAVVARVTPETFYSQQGRLQPGDVIYAVNGKTISSVEELRTTMAGLKTSAPTVLLIERDSTLMYLAFRIDR